MPTWTTISQVRPADQILWRTDRDRPAMRYEQEDNPPSTFQWLTVASVEVDGRSRVLRLFDGTEFDAGHAYRLWVRHV